MTKHSIEPGQKCLACGVKDATSANGTVPLCAECAAKAQESKRGVKFDKKASHDSV
jgi:hypothetical protein